MARTPLLRFAQSLARRHDTPPRGMTRRELLAGASVLAAGLAAPKRTWAATPRVAIVGGGIAGLTAAYALQRGGVASTVYEASGRVGGRMESDTTSWAGGQVSEHCGELIDTGHFTIRELARRFRLPLANLARHEVQRSDDVFFFGGGYYTFTEALADFAPVALALQADVDAAGFPTLYNAQNAAGAALDAMSVSDWIESRVPGGHGSRMGQLLEVAYLTEYGLETPLQSALNLVYLLGFQPSTHGLSLYGESNERLHIRGGNEQLPRAIAGVLPPQAIEYGARMTRIARNGDDTFTIGFASRPDVVADHVVLALPFSVLRGCDYAAAGFNAVKRAAIEQLGYGTNAKLQLQFDGRGWRGIGPDGRSTGGSFVDTGYQVSWDVTRGQRGTEGILVSYTGGDIGAALTDTSAAGVAAAAATFLTDLEPVFPGVASTWNGRATLSTPAYEPLRLGSYSAWKVGQYTTFAGAERERSGNCHFAGEHCSIDFQGFMEGGAQEGLRAAREILADLR